MNQSSDIWPMLDELARMGATSLSRDGTKRFLNLSITLRDDQLTPELLLAALVLSRAIEASDERRAALTPPSLTTPAPDGS